MINFYLLPFFQEQSNWKGFQRPCMGSDLWTGSRRICRE